LVSPNDLPACVRTGLQLRLSASLLKACLLTLAIHIGTGNLNSRMSSARAGITSVTTVRKRPTFRRHRLNFHLTQYDQSHRDRSYAETRRLNAADALLQHESGQTNRGDRIHGHDHRDQRQVPLPNCEQKQGV